MLNNGVLTKFMEYRPEIFCYPRLKVTLPADFNDPFDTQLRLSENDTKKLSEKHSISIEKVLYYAKRLQTVHILSLSKKHALSADSANMWGLYAKSGKGLAFEFDYNDVDYYLSNRDLQDFLLAFKNAVDKEHYLKNNLNEALYLKMQGFVKEVRDRFKQMKRFLIVFKDFPELWTPADELLNITYKEFLKSDKIKDFMSETLLPNSFTFRSLLNLTSPLFKVKYAGREMLDIYVGREMLDIYVGREMLDIFEDYLQKGLRSLDQRTEVQEFMTTKSNIWEHEDEYRILVYDQGSQVIKKADAALLSNCQEHSEKNYDEALKRLEEAGNELYFINFSNNFKVESIEVVSQNAGKVESGFIPKIYLPFPIKIYLGWNFDTESANGTEQLKHIKEYARKYKIELCKLNKKIDYTTKEKAVFMADEIEI